MKNKMMNFVDGLKSIKVGQKVIVTNGQSGRYHYRSTESEVTKIGNKYVTVGRRMQFDFEGVENTKAGTKGSIYSSKKEYDRVKEENKIIDKVQRVMMDWRSYKIDYEQALKIAKILNINLD